VKHVRTVAVIGAGAAGRAFALRCAGAGFAVVLEDVMPGEAAPRAG
jgi:3-hydroxybutyryl-CoA dehydrogenase